MTTKDEALKLALEALEWAEFLVESDERSCQDAKHSVDKAITAIREALAEQPACEHEWLRGACLKCGQSIEQPASVEPVAWMFTDKEGTEFFEQHEDWEGRWTPLYTSPPASKPWLGLTFKEKKEIERLSVYVEGAIRHTEAKLKAKNA